MNDAKSSAKGDLVSDFRAPGWSLVRLFIFPVLLSLSIVYEVVITAILSPGALQTPTYILGVLLLAFFWWSALTTTFAVTVRSDDTMELRSLIHRVTLRPHEVIRIIRTSSKANMTLKYQGGKTRILSSIVGISDFLTWLRNRNPNVAIAGPPRASGPTAATPNEQDTGPATIPLWSPKRLLRGGLSVALVVVGVRAGFLLAFLSGLIFLPDYGIPGALLYSAFLGAVGGGLGGYVAGLGGRNGAAIGALGGLLALAFSMAELTTGQYTPPPLGVHTPWWVPVARAVVFMLGSIAGGFLAGKSKGEAPSSRFLDID